MNTRNYLGALGTLIAGIACTCCITVAPKEPKPPEPDPDYGPVPLDLFTFLVEHDDMGNLTVIPHPNSPDLIEWVGPDGRKYVATLDPEVKVQIPFGASLSAGDTFELEAFELTSTVQP